MKKSLILILCLVSEFSVAEMFCPDPKLTNWPVPAKKNVDCVDKLDEAQSKTIGKNVQMVDLNSDSICEYFVNVGGASSGTEYHIYTLAKGELKLIGMYFAWSIDLRGKINGWHSLYSRNVSSDEEFHTLFAFDGKKYSVSKQEVNKCDNGEL